MQRGSSRVISRVGSYFGVDNTEDSSLDLWREKIERAAKKETFNVSLANLLPATPHDPDDDIKLLEDALANAEHMTSDGLHSLSNHLMAQSHERVIAVQELDDGDVGTLSHEQIISVQDLDDEGALSVKNDGESYVLQDRTGTKGAESIVDGDTGDIEICASGGEKPVPERRQDGGSEALAVYGAGGTASVLTGRHLTKQTGSRAGSIQIMEEGERRPSVSFCPTVSVVEFEKTKDFEEASMKGLLGSILKLRTHKTAEVDAQDKDTNQREVVQYQTTLTSSSPTSNTDGVKKDGSRQIRSDVDRTEYRLNQDSSDESEDEMLYGSQAVSYYETLCKAREELPESHEQQMILENMRIKEELLDAVMESAKESENASQSRSKFFGIPLIWKSSKTIKPHPTLSSQIRVQIEELPDYKPYVTLVISLTQLMVFILLWYFGGTAPIGLRPNTVYLDDVKTFRGTETVVGVQYPNVWIGPTAAFWIRKGAIFAPCLRSDYKINVMLSKQGYQTSEELGCCEVQRRNTAGTTTRHECEDQTYGAGIWQAIECGKRAAGDNNIQHILKPCCYRLTGECKMTTHQHCTFLGGYYHVDGPEHCSKVNCLADVCGLGGFTMQADQEHPFMPVQPNQWWRLLISPFYHNGLLHLILVLISQLVLAIPIERMAGGVRLFLIYILSDVIGNLLASLFTPYLPHMGGSAAVCGLIAVQSIELAQSWVLVKRPLWTILKLLAILLICALSGTLPYLDNFAHIGGFATGILTGVIFLPYIVFGDWHSRRRRMILVLFIPLLFCLFCLLLLVFYKIQDVAYCTACHVINCIPYTPYLCNTTWYNPQPHGS